MGDAYLSSFFAKFESDELGLGFPPMLKAAKDGKNAWKHVDELDFELMGYFPVLSSDGRALHRSVLAGALPRT